MSLYFLITLVFELFLALAIFYFIPNIYGYIFGGLFLISGIFRAFIQKSRALFFSDIEDFIEINRGYGYFRVSAFVSVLAVFLWELGGNLGSFSLFSISVYLFILFFYILWISNLYPYCTKQEDLKNTIVILRHIAETDGIKLNKIARKEGFSKEFTNKQADNLEEANFIKIFNKRGHLEKTYEEIYNLGDRL